VHSNLQGKNVTFATGNEVQCFGKVTVHLGYGVSWSPMHA